MAFPISAGRSTSSNRLIERIARVAAVAIGIIAAPGLAVAYPMIAQDFTSTVTANVDETTILQLFAGYDSGFTPTATTDSVQIFYSFSTSQVGFIFQNSGDRILVNLASDVPAFFGFTPTTFLNLTCAFDGRSGARFTTMGGSGDIAEINVCANGNIPLDAAFTLTDSSVIDLLFVGGTWRPGAIAPSNFDGMTTSSIPEPSSMAVMGIGLAGAAWSAWRRKQGSRSRT